MNILLWGIFYLVTAAFLVYFFFKEKEVIDFVKAKNAVKIDRTFEA